MTSMTGAALTNEADDWAVKAYGPHIGGYLESAYLNV